MPRAPVPRGPVSRAPELDRVDRGIIEALQRNGRESFRRIAASLGGERGDRPRPVRAALRPEHPPGHRRHEPARPRVRGAGDGRRPDDRAARATSRTRSRRGTEADYVVVTDRPLRLARRGRLPPIARGLLDVTSRIASAARASSRPRRSSTSSCGSSSTTGVRGSPATEEEGGEREHDADRTFGSRTSSRSSQDTSAVAGISLEIPRGSFFALLGPSGCGKTTTLRMIGGFEEPTSGRIFLGDRDVVGLPPYKRDVNTVFQSYALFPHMTIADNVGFGLERKGIPKGEIRTRVARGARARRPRRPRRAASRSSSRAGSSSGSRSPARSSTTRASCCSTSRSGRSTSSCASRCSSS